ncbi:hypothetical protein VPH35_014268 [Triticum aestivum]
MERWKMKKDRRYWPAGHEEEGTGAYADLFSFDSLYFFLQNYRNCPLCITEFFFFLPTVFTEILQCILVTYYILYSCCSCTSILLSIYELHHCMPIVFPVF